MLFSTKFLTDFLNKRFMSDAQETKLDGVESGATADQTGAEIKTAYEGEADTNAFTDAEESKLSGIEASATADQTGAQIKTAYEAESDTNAFTDADETNLDAQSGTNTGDEVAATESVAGIAEIATQAETDAGTDDVAFITPLKLEAKPGMFANQFQTFVEASNTATSSALPITHQTFTTASLPIGTYEVSGLLMFTKGIGTNTMQASVTFAGNTGTVTGTTINSENVQSVDNMAIGSFPILGELVVTGAGTVDFTVSIGKSSGASDVTAEYSRINIRRVL